MKITLLSLPATMAFMALILSAAPCRAEKAADLKPVSAKPGKVMFEDSFDSALANTWKIQKGTWEIKDGAVAGVIKKEDNHAAVLFLDVPNRNAVIRLSFKLADAKGFGLSYNSAKGHLFRINVTSQGLTVSKDRDKKDEKSKNDVLAKAEGKFEPGTWHSMLVEVQGGKVTVQTDGGAKAEASNSELDVDKTGFRFVTGSSVQLDDIKIWQAE